MNTIAQQYYGLALEAKRSPKWAIRQLLALGRLYPQFSAERKLIADYIWEIKNWI